MEGKCRVRKDRAGLKQVHMGYEAELMLSREAEGLGWKRHGPDLLHLASGRWWPLEAFALLDNSLLWKSFLPSLCNPSLSPSHPIPELCLVEAIPWLDYWILTLPGILPRPSCFVLQLYFPQVILSKPMVFI